MGSALRVEGIRFGRRRVCGLTLRAGYITFWEQKTSVVNKILIEVIHRSLLSHHFRLSRTRVRIKESIVAKTSTRSRKFKAILAGGIVLGVGAAVTLAAWTDQEWAEGIFGAGDFNVEGSTTGAEDSFDDHTSSDGAAELSFELPASDNLSPGDAVAAPFVLRLDEATTYDATVDLTSAAGTGDNASNLTYGIVQVANAGACEVGATGTQIVPSGTALTATTGKQGFNLAAGADGAAGAPVTLCFTVTAGDDLTEGDAATAQWQFTATSAE